MSCKETKKKRKKARIKLKSNEIERFLSSVGDHKSWKIQVHGPRKKKKKEQRSKGKGENGFELEVVVVVVVVRSFD